MANFGRKMHLIPFGYNCLILSFNEIWCIFVAFFFIICQLKTKKSKLTEINSINSQILNFKKGNEDKKYMTIFAFRF